MGQEEQDDDEKALAERRALLNEIKMLQCSNAELRRRLAELVRELARRS